MPYTNHEAHEEREEDLDNCALRFLAIRALPTLRVFCVFRGPISAGVELG